MTPESPQGLTPDSRVELNDDELKQWVHCSFRVAWIPDEESLRAAMKRAIEGGRLSSGQSFDLPACGQGALRG
jgi:hypothetical protein